MYVLVSLPLVTAHSTHALMFIVALPVIYYFIISFNGQFSFYISTERLMHIYLHRIKIILSAVQLLACIINKIQTCSLLMLTMQKKQMVKI